MSKTFPVWSSDSVTRMTGLAVSLSKLGILFSLTQSINSSMTHDIGGGVGGIGHIEPA